MCNTFSELSVGMTTEGIDVRSVGNTLTLHETALIEAFNLKAAIEYQLKNCKYFLFSVLLSSFVENRLFILYLDFKCVFFFILYR